MKVTKATLTYRQKVLLGNYLTSHYRTNENGEAVQTSIVSINDMIKELNESRYSGECEFNDNHIHHARQELFGKMAKEQLNKMSTPEVLNKLMEMETRIKFLENSLGVKEER